MSVINQMLKDLDQRQVDQEGSGNLAVPASSTSSNKNILFISILIIVFLNIVGLFVWQMYVENQALKKANGVELSSGTTPILQKIVTEIEPSVEDKKISELVITPIIKDKTVTKNNESAKPEPTLPRQIQTSNIAVEASVRESGLAGNSAENNLAKLDVPAIKAEPIAKKSSLKISRKQLSPRELAQQKVKRAEQALANKDILKAEHLFEDVLLIIPEHKSARKQLAALWFGRKAYSDALNLLSQGISLSPEDSEFRMMQARIYLQKNRVKNAFTILNTIPKVNELSDVEYQSLRATTAQQLGEFLFAIEAYKLLTEIEPSSGRWWLGLGVAYDSNSEFKPASVAYKSALSKIGLSDSAESFVRQRIIELGE